MTIEEFNGEHAIFSQQANGDIKAEISLEDLMEAKVWKMEYFFNGNIDEVKMVMKDLSRIERAFLFSIIPYIGDEDCRLSHLNGKDIIAKDLVPITNIGKSKIYEIINSLIQKDIIYKGNNSNSPQYFVNPWLFCKGHRINKVLQTMFQNYRIRVLNGVKWKDV